MYAYPVFPRQSATSTRLLMAPSAEAKRLETVESGRAKHNEEVLAEASSFVSTNGGDPGDRFLVLAHCKLQFGKYQGQRFRWLLENSLGYAVYLVLSISKETAQKTPLSENKQLFLQYTSHIREMAEEVEKYERKQEMQAEARATGDQGCLMVEFGDFQGPSMKGLNLSTYCFQIHYCSPLYLLQQQNSQPEAPHRPKDSFSLPLCKHHLTSVCICVLFVVIVLTFVLQACPFPLLKMTMTRS